jgi:type IV pilus assembly protein PilF
VALEELTMAIVIDPDYARPTARVDWLGFTIREMALPTRTFSGLSLDANDPEINNNYGWFLCQVGREKEAIPTCNER